MQFTPEKHCHERDPDENNGGQSDPDRLGVARRLYDPRGTGFRSNRGTRQFPGGVRVFSRRRNLRRRKGGGIDGPRRWRRRAPGERRVQLADLCTPSLDVRIVGRRRFRGRYRIRGGLDGLRPVQGSQRNLRLQLQTCQIPIVSQPVNRLFEYLHRPFKFLGGNQPFGFRAGLRDLLSPALCRRYSGGFRLLGFSRGDLSANILQQFFSQLVRRIGRQDFRNGMIRLRQILFPQQVLGFVQALVANSSLFHLAGDPIHTRLQVWIGHAQFAHRIQKAGRIFEALLADSRLGLPEQGLEAYRGIAAPYRFFNFGPELAALLMTGIEPQRLPYRGLREIQLSGGKKLVGFFVEPVGLRAAQLRKYVARISKNVRQAAVARFALACQRPQDQTFEARGTLRRRLSRRLRLGVGDLEDDAHGVGGGIGIDAGHEFVKRDTVRKYICQRVRRPAEDRKS